MSRALNPYISNALHMYIYILSTTSGLSYPTQLLKSSRKLDNFTVSQTFTQLYLSGLSSFASNPTASFTQLTCFPHSFPVKITSLTPWGNAAHSWWIDSCDSYQVQTTLPHYSVPELYENTWDSYGDCAERTARQKLKRKTTNHPDWQPVSHMLTR